MNLKRYLALVLVVFISACGGGGGNADSGNLPPSLGGNPDYDFNILMMGNSHTAPIPSVLVKIFNQAQPQATINIIRAPGYMYLIDRMNDQENLNLLNQEAWTHVVLQALKYSSSGTISYPTTGAEYFIGETTALGATAVLYPEHPRRGNTWESQYLFQLHSSVAAEHPACVAPIGFVWEDFKPKSDLELHASDGNHATSAGVFLSALIFYQIISQTDITMIPYITDVGVSEANQQYMKASINDIIATYEPCIYLNP